LHIYYISYNVNPGLINHKWYPPNSTASLGVY
jgi:hypothetical protein